MNVKELIKITLLEFRDNFIGLLIATLPYIAGAIVFEFYIKEILLNFNNALSVFLAYVMNLVLGALITFSGLKYFFDSAGKTIGIDRKKVINYIVATIFISIAAGLGFVIFIIPGLIVLTVSLLYPAFIINDNLGPFAAVEASIDALKDNFIAICLVYACLWFSITIVTYALSYTFHLVALPELVQEVLIAFLSYFLNLIFIPLIFLLYGKKGYIDKGYSPGFSADN